jgi:CDP-glucose 4,6-dehydratase
MPDRDYIWENRRVLITGAGGFVGKQLGRHLVAQGARVTRWLHGNGKSGKRNESESRNRSFVNGSVTDLRSLSGTIENREIEVVFHLAASNANRTGGDSAYRIFETNTRGTYTLLEAARSASSPPRVVLLSSREAEVATRQPTHAVMQPYAASKIAAEVAANAYAEALGLQVVIVRTGNVYGPGDMNIQRLVPATALSLLAGEDPVLKGQPEMLRDYLYIDDFLAACVNCAEKAHLLAGQDRVVRVASGLQTSAISVVEKLLFHAGRPDLLPVIASNFVNERVDSAYTPTLEHELLGWKSEIGLDEGLRRAYEWYACLHRRLGAERLNRLCRSVL